MDGSESTSAVTTMVCGMVSDGTWSLLDALYVFAINSTANATLNWKSTSFGRNHYGRSSSARKLDGQVMHVGC
jgi:hypothetical protein